MAKIIILNGPPRCGKDTAAEAIVRYFTTENVSHHKFSRPLKDIVASVTGQEYKDLETIKDQQQEFAGSFRELQIATYEALSKVFSQQWLGEILCHKIAKDQNDLIVCSDGGRIEDLIPLFRRNHQVMVIQILRDGCHFNYDIRGYISSPRAAMRTILNKNKEVFETQIIDIAAEFFANG